MVRKMKMEMKSWCHNALEIQASDDAIKKSINSLFNGTHCSRFAEIGNKLRKMFFAGASGFLVPHTSTSESQLNDIFLVCPALSTQSKSDSEESKAYSAFLVTLLGHAIEDNNADYFASLYSRSGLEHLSYCELTTDAKEVMSSLASQSPGNWDSDTDFERWWSSVDKPTLKETGIFDLRSLLRIPVSTVINGNTGCYTNDDNLNTYYSKQFGITTPKLNLEQSSTECVVFLSPEHPPKNLDVLLPEFVIKSSQLDDDFVYSNLTVQHYFYNTSSRIQGINGNKEMMKSINESNGGEVMEFNLDIANAFGIFND